MKRYTKIISSIKCKYIILLVSALVCYLFWISLVKINKNVPIIIWWTPLITDTDRIIHCYNNNFQCLVSGDRYYTKASEAFLFYGSHLQPYDLPLPRHRNHLWALFHEESPKNLATLLFQDTQILFNVTATFSRYSDFPLTLQYLPSLDNITDTSYYINVTDKNNLLIKLSPVLYVQSNCDTPSQRDSYVIELMKHLKIDSYGLCVNNKHLPRELADKDPLDFYNEEFLKLTAKYKFTLAIENAICEDYITEKVWRPLIAGSIPIYLGSPSIEDWLPNANSAILMKNYENAKELAAFINLLNNNDTLYETYMVHKIKRLIENENLLNALQHKEPNEESLILQFECFICKNIHERCELKDHERSVFKCPQPPGSTAEYPWVSHWILGKCQSKAFRSLVEKNSEFTKEEYDSKWSLLYESGDC